MSAAPSSKLLLSLSQCAALSSAVCVMKPTVQGMLSAVSLCPHLHLSAAVLVEPGLTAAELVCCSICQVPCNHAVCCSICLKICCLCCTSYGMHAPNLSIASLLAGLATEHCKEVNGSLMRCLCSAMATPAAPEQSLPCMALYLLQLV